MSEKELEKNGDKEVRFLYEKMLLTEQQYSMGVSAIAFDDAKELCRKGSIAFFAFLPIFCIFALFFA